MSKIIPLDLTLTLEVKAHFGAFLEGITDFTPTLTLLKARRGGDTEDRWLYAAYSPEQIMVLTPELEAQEHALLYSFDGMVAAIPQFNLLPELSGNKLALGPRGLAVVPRHFGI